MVRQFTEKKAIVIGGGFSGLATAALLGRAGWSVDLFEKNPTLGGRARVFSKKGFHFDMGPSWYMMPEVFDRFFAHFGKKVQDYYALKRLDPRYTIFFGDNSRVVLHDSLKKNVEMFEKFERGAGKKLVRYLQDSKKVYELAARHLVYEDIFYWRSWLGWVNLRSIVKIFLILRCWETWHATVARIFHSKKIHQILEFTSVFLGGSPYLTPSLYSVLSWADFGGGIWYPLGGMGVVVNALERLAIAQGVRIHRNEPVVQILVQEKRVVGVRTQKGDHAASVVVAATDIPYVESSLLPGKWSRTLPSPDHTTYGISAIMVYLGVSKKIPRLSHHTLFFSADWKQHFDEIFASTTVFPSHPSLYVSVRTKTEPKLAPPGCEELVMLIPCPSSLEYSDEVLARYVDQAITKVEDALSVSFSDHIVYRRVFGPKEFHQEYSASFGTALGLAHTFSQSLWGRWGSHHHALAGLYYAGQYTNPGIGVPMALVSAEIVAADIARHDHIASRVFSKGSVTYYYSSLFFPSEVRQDVAALYAYVRIVDDCVDIHPADRQRFERMWEDTQRVWNGGASDDAIVNAFVRMAQAHAISWELVVAFWNAMRRDLVPNQTYSEEELLTYMYGSAEVIGLMMSQIMKLDKRAAHAARMQGRAMQYINFIRDVMEDEGLGRRYLGYSDGMRDDPEAWGRFVRPLIAKYYQMQSEAEKGYAFLPRRFRIPVKTAALLYGWTARQIERDPMIVWRKKVKPHPIRVLLTALFTMVHP